MSFLGNPKLLYFTRLAQLILAVLFLVLICYSGAHRGWWDNIDGPLALGVIASIFTFAVTIHTIFTHHRSNPFSGGSTTYTIARIVAEVVVFLLWVASAGLMLRSRDGCSVRVRKEEDACYNPRNGDLEYYYSDQPRATWYAAVAVGLLEA
ncbi:MAG: hypothetical protein Q9183_000562 [Haloplaca sp. 2 TL-2023]